LDHTGVAVYADPALWDPPSLPRFDFLMIESISYLPPERRMKRRREMKAIVKQSTPHFVSKTNLCAIIRVHNSINYQNRPLFMRL